MDDEKLIELVRENRVLYDLSHPKYMDTNHKTKLWSKIGAQITLDGKLCKARWSNIRDNYRKSLKKTHTKLRKKKTVKLYKYNEQLSFLKDFFTEGKRKESVDQEVDSELQELEDGEDNQKHNFTPIYITSLHGVSASSPIQGRTPSPNYVVTVSPSHVNTSSSSPVPTQSHSKTILQKTEATSIMDYVLQKNQANSELTLHPVDAFLNGIAPPLKSLNQYYLHMAKSEIFATVQKYELKMMTDQGQHIL